MDIIKTRFEEHIALAQLVAQSEIMQQVADAAAIIKKALANARLVSRAESGSSALLRCPASASALGRASRLADRCAKNPSLFPPQAAVGSAAVRIHPPSESGFAAKQKPQRTFIR